MVNLDELKALSQPQGMAASMAKLEPARLIRPELGEELNLAELEPDFAKLVEIAGHMATLPLNELPTSLVEQLSNAWSALNSRLKHVREFGINKYDQHGNTPVLARRGLIDATRASLRDFYAAAAPAMGFAAATAASGASGALGRDLEEGRQQLEAALAEAKAGAASVASLVKVSQDAAQEVGIARHAAHFAQAAAAHEKVAGHWLWAVGGSVLVTVLAAAWNLFIASDVTRTPSPAAAAHLIVAKLVLFSVLASVTVWCGRVYRAHRHNAVVNRHRQNALSSFETFAQSTDDPGTRNAVLIQATQSIFSPQPTGYAPGEAELAGPSQLIELVRALPPASK